MEQVYIQLLQQYPYFSIIISLVVSVLVSIFFLPSIFITTANILVFGPVQGVFLSYAGEVIGSVATYYLYQYGLMKFEVNVSFLDKYQKYLSTNSVFRSFVSVFLLRLVPFVPSSGVTVYAVITKMKVFPYFIGTALGKIPSLLVEGVVALGISTVLATKSLTYIGILATIGIVVVVVKKVRE